MVRNIIMSGQELLEVKNSLEHGRFIEWVERDVEMSIRTAQNYMRVAKWAKALPGDKYATVSHLPPKTLYLLAARSTPEDIGKEVIADIEADTPIDNKRIKARIEEAQVEQEEIAQNEPKPGQKARKPRRPRKEVQRDHFLGPVMAWVTGVKVASGIEVPRLNAEDAKKAIAALKEAEAALRSVRRKVEAQHVDANLAPVVEQQDPDHDDLLVIPEAFRRNRES